MHSLLNSALQYAETGLVIFPAPPGTKMSYKSARYNGGMRWGATRHPEEIRRDWTRWPDANVCIVTGACSGIFVVEADTAVGHAVDGISELAQCIAHWGEWPVTLKAQSPSGSEHHYFQWPTDGKIIRNSTGKIGPGIDVRGEGGMVVAPPSRRKDGEYRWMSNAPIAKAPDWLLGLIAENERTRIGEADIETVAVTLVAETVKHVPTQLEWQDRNNIGMAIWACTRGSREGWQIWDDWLMRSGKYAPGASRARWRAMTRSPPTDIGYGTLEYLAFQNDPHWWAKYEKELLKSLQG